jgi:hypothetical protein
VRLIQFYLDEDAMDSGLVTALRSQGVTLITAGEVNLANYADLEHLTYASACGCVLYSFNASDYCRLHEEWIDQGRKHAGIIAAPQQTFSIGEQMRRLLRIRAALSADEMVNRIEFLTAWS